MVIIADRTCAGDQRGRSPITNAASPATCGALVDVPDARSHDRPESDGGATAPSTPTPGAVRSGLSTSPPGTGPRAENLASPGTAGPDPGAAASRAVARAPARRTYALTAAACRASRCTVGTACTSASVLSGRVFASTMATPPETATDVDLSTRGPPPRSQTTIRPSVAAESSAPVAHCRAATRLTPSAATSAPSTIRAAGTRRSATMTPS